jgi:hypothetical protein
MALLIQFLLIGLDCAVLTSVVLKAPEFEVFQRADPKARMKPKIVSKHRAGAANT